MESWGPKGTIVVNMELGDYLNVGAYPTQGNGASILGPGINTTLKRSRRYTFNTISQHNGIRYYSKISSPQVINMTKEMEAPKWDLPKRFEKLTKFCVFILTSLVLSYPLLVALQPLLYWALANKRRGNLCSSSCAPLAFVRLRAKVALLLAKVVRASCLCQATSKGCAATTRKGY